MPVVGMFRPNCATPCLIAIPCNSVSLRALFMAPAESLANPRLMSFIAAWNFPVAGLIPMRSMPRWFASSAAWYPCLTSAAASAVRPFLAFLGIVCVRLLHHPLFQRRKELAVSLPLRFSPCCIGVSRLDLLIHDFLDERVLYCCSVLLPRQLLLR